MTPLSLLLLSSTWSLVTAFMPRRTTVCTIEEDPIVTPFVGSKFEFDRSGTFYAIKSTEMTISITTGTHWSWSTFTYVDVVDSVTYVCGSKPPRTFSPDDLTTKSITLPCDNGACTGSTCYATIARGTWPYKNVDLQAIVYKGNQGICGLCYDTDCEKPTPPGPPTPGSYCKPVVKNGDLSLCSIFDDPLVSPFNIRKNFEYDTLGSTYAVRSDEFTVQFVIGQHYDDDGNIVRVVDSLSYTCANGDSGRFTPRDLAVLHPVTINCPAGTCGTNGCWMRLSRGLYPVDNVDVQALAYYGTKGIEGICYTGTDLCPKTTTTLTLPASTVARTRTIRTTAVPTTSSLPYCKPVIYTGDESFCSISEDPWVQPFNGQQFQYNTVGPVYALQSNEFSVKIAIGKHEDDDGNTVEVVDSLEFTCADGQSAVYTPSDLHFHTPTIINCRVGSCGYDGCFMQLLKGRTPVENVDIQVLAYFGSHGVGGICYTNDMCIRQTSTIAAQTTNVRTKTAAVSSIATTSSSLYCKPIVYTGDESICVISEDPWVTPFNGAQFQYDNVGTVYALRSEEFSVQITIGEHEDADGNTVSVVDSLSYSCADGQSGQYTPSDLHVHTSVTINCRVGTCGHQGCVLKLARGKFPVDNVDIQALAYLGSRGIEGICYPDNMCKKMSSSWTSFPASTSDIPKTKTNGYDSSTLSSFTKTKITSVSAEQTAEQTIPASSTTAVQQFTRTFSATETGTSSSDNSSSTGSTVLTESQIATATTESQIATATETKTLNTDVTVSALTTSASNTQVSISAEVSTNLPSQSTVDVTLTSSTNSVLSTIESVISSSLLPAATTLTGASNSESSASLTVTFTSEIVTPSVSTSTSVSEDRLSTPTETQLISSTSEASRPTATSTNVISSIAPDTSSSATDLPSTISKPTVSPITALASSGLPLETTVTAASNPGTVETVKNSFTTDAVIPNTSTLSAGSETITKAASGTAVKTSPTITEVETSSDLISKATVAATVTSSGDSATSSISANTFPASVSVISTSLVTVTSDLLSPASETLKTTSETTIFASKSVSVEPVNSASTLSNNPSSTDYTITQSVSHVIQTGVSEIASSFNSASKTSIEPQPEPTSASVASLSQSRTFARTETGSSRSEVTSSPVGTLPIIDLPATGKPKSTVSSDVSNTVTSAAAATLPVINLPATNKPDSNNPSQPSYVVPKPQPSDAYVAPAPVPSGYLAPAPASNWQAAAINSTQKLNPAANVPEKNNLQSGGQKFVTTMVSLLIFLSI